jgi:hypothetical protein
MNPPGADPGLLGPAPDEIHDLIPRIVRNPDPGQSSPISFFSVTCSAISSARTSSVVWIFLSRQAIRSCSAEWLGVFSARRQKPRSRFGCFFMRSLDYLTGSMLSPFPTEPDYGVSSDIGRAFGDLMCSWRQCSRWARCMPRWQGYRYMPSRLRRPANPQRRQAATLKSAASIYFFAWNPASAMFQENSHPPIRSSGIQKSKTNSLGSASGKSGTNPCRFFAANSVILCLKTVVAGVFPSKQPRCTPEAGLP